MALVTFLLLVLEICVAVKSEVELQKRIIGGRDCNNNERHYHVKLTAEITVNGQTRQSLCGGSLISDQWVLTAAHCWIDEPGWVHTAVVGVHPKKSKIRPKTWFLSTNTMKIKNNPVIYTDQNNNKHDIMLLKLPEKIKRITPVKLPDCNNKVGAKVQIAGFGPTSLGPNGYGPWSTVLQCADFNIVNCDTIKQLSQIEGHAMGYQHWFCVQSSGVRTCPGDSGGGAVYNNMIYGVHVASTGITGNTNTVCSLYAREMDVCKYEAWIKQTITL